MKFAWSQGAEELDRAGRRPVGEALGGEVGLSVLEVRLEGPPPICDVGIVGGEER